MATSNVVVTVPEREIIAGRDGFDPIVETEAIEHGNRVTITDRNGPHSFDVMDGASAYEQAAAGGYEDTEAQFNEDLANFKTLHDETVANVASASNYAGAAGGSAAEASGKASEASESAASAASYAGSANDSALLAAQFENNASDYAGRANAFAGDAEYSASVASSEKTAAEAAQAEATRQAGIAETQASAAATSAGAASTSATNAATSASNAAASATAAGNAQTAAETAQGLAETAQAAAETAQGLAETAAESVSDSVEQISQNASDISGLKSALSVETVLNGWEKGSFNTTNGADYSDNSRIRCETAVGVSTGVLGFTLADGYSTLMYAWDLSGNYVGAYKTDGTWSKTASDWKSVTEFDLRTVPNYVVKLAMARVPSSSDITTDEGSNVEFDTCTDATLTLGGKAADAKKTGDEIGNLKSALSSDMFAERYVKYNSLTPYSMSSNADRPDFTRYGNRFTFNGSFGSSTAYYIKLSEAGSTNYSKSGNTASTWEKQVQFLAGHTYRAKLTLISGSYTVATGGYIIVNLYKSDGTSIYFGFDEVVFTPGAVTSNVVFIATGGTVLTNAEFTFTIEDITESSLATSAKTVNGAINELDGDINGLNGLIAKCLTSDYTQATVITAESDFNDYTTDGNYRVGSDATATQGTGIKNMPLQKAGRLFVMHPHNSTRLVQIWIMAQANAIWVRRYTTSWSTWYTLLQSGDIVDSVTNGLWNPISSNGVYNAIAKTPKNTMGLAYSWWVNNRVMDSYGNLYFGYISDDKNGMKCGVGCRYPDGSVNRRDIFSSNEDDDHNAPSVILITKDNKEYVCVIGSTGHNTDSKINCYIATESNSITCDFTNVTHTMTQPEGYTLKNSYSQAYYDNGNSKIYNFFRVKQYPTGQSGDFYMLWLCAIGSVADDLSVTWTIYRVFALNSPQGASEPVQKGTLFYMWSQNVDNNDYMKRIVIQCNATYGSGDSLRSIRTGIVDCQNLKIYSAYADTTHDPVSDYLCDMSVVADGELPYDPEDTSTTIALYDDFTEVVPVDSTDNYRYRILDVFQSRKVELSILYAKSATNPSGANGHKEIRDWILYKRAKSDFSSQSAQWVTTEIAHLGRQFFDSSCYVTGASFINNSKNEVVYSKNDVSTEDGKHSLHYAQIANDVVTTDRVIKRSAHTLARPAQFDDGSIMYLVGNYNIGDGISEEGYMKWHFGIQFMDGIEENTVDVGT